MASFNPMNPANKAKFLKDNPELTDKDFDNLFKVKKKKKKSLLKTGKEIKNGS